MNTYTKNTLEMGRGVFASRDINTNEIIEECDVILIPKTEAIEFIHKTVLNMYGFGWKEEGTAIALGNGSLYNHQWIPNVDEYLLYKDRKIIFLANKDIKKDEELFINYQYNPEYGKRIYEDVVNNYQNKPRSERPWPSKYQY